MKDADPQVARVRKVAKAPGAYLTISEVSDELSIPQHVLRFWEAKFPQIRPLKRGGGRRYYRPEDIDVLRKIRSFLYDDGYTIRGVQKILREGVKSNKIKNQNSDDSINSQSIKDEVDSNTKQRLRAIAEELSRIRELLRKIRL